MKEQENRKLKQFDCVVFRKLFSYFTKESIALFDNGFIGFHPEIADDIVNEIMDTIRQSHKNLA